MKRILLLMFVLVPMILVAQDKKWDTKDLFKMQMAVGPQLDPTGSHVAYGLTVPRPFSEKAGGDYMELHVKNLKTGEDKVFLNAKTSFRSIRWMDGGKSISFLAALDGEKKTQLYKISINGGVHEKLTDFEHGISSYQWNPKKNEIAILATEKDKSGEDMAAKGFNAEVVEHNIPHQNLYIYDLDKNTSTQISKDMTVYAISWNPQGTLIAAQTSEKNLIDWKYIFCKLQIIDPATKAVKELVDHQGKMTDMKWSPDGSKLALISGIDIWDPVNGSLFIIDANNTKKWSELTNHTKDFAGSVTHLEWKDSKTLLFSSDESVHTTIRSIPATGGATKVIVDDKNTVFSSFDYAAGKMVFSGNTDQMPSEVFLHDMKKMTRLTFNNAWIKDYKFGKQERYSWKADDGLLIEGVLIYPVDFKEGTKYPMINYIHGGPESCVKDGWSTYYSMWGQVAAARGYFVLMPNYRGSSGRGVAYSKADQKDQGGLEFQDVIDGIESLVAKGWVDAARVGIGGGSYGGYFSAWGATKHTKIFAASCMFVGISDQVSKRYTTDIPNESYYSHWNVHTHEARDLMIERSPVTYAHESVTPTLILHGKEDPRVHPSQSLELYRALQMYGKAPTRLVWYPGEGHGNRKNPAKMDYNIRTMNWFDYYLKGDNDKTKTPSADIEFDLEGLE